MTVTGALSASSAASRVSRRCNCSAPSKPVARNGGVGTAVDKPTSAMPPRRRTNGKPSRRHHRAYSPTIVRRACVTVRAHIRVVIAGNERHVIAAARPRQEKRAPRRTRPAARHSPDRRSPRCDPGRCAAMSARIASSASSAMLVAPPPMPIGKTDRAFADEFAQARTRNRRQMRIGKVRQNRTSGHREHVVQNRMLRSLAGACRSIANVQANAAIK